MKFPDRPAGPESFASEVQLLAYLRQIHDDFTFFVEELWKDRGYDRFAPIGEMERDICTFIASSGHPRRGVLGPRGVGKTFWGSSAYSAWRIRRDPKIKILIVSKSKIPAARDIVRLVKGWLKNVWFLKDLDPSDNHSELATDQTFQFDVAGADDAKTPTMMAQGIEGQITSSRAHLVIGDDVETPENTKTVAARHELDEKVKEFFNIAKYGDKEVLYFGTYHNEESVYIKLAKRGYHFQTWPFTYPLEGETFLNLAPLVARKLASGEGLPGSPTFSHRYTAHDVTEAQAEGRMHWLMQYQLCTNLAEGNRFPLKLSDLIVFPCERNKAPVSIAWGTKNGDGNSTAEEMEIAGWEGDRLYGPIMFDKEWSAYTGTKAWVDPAGRGTDKTGLAIIGHVGGILYVKACYGLEGGASSERMDEIARLLRQHGARDCYVETNIDAFNTYFDLLDEAIRRHFIEPGADGAFPDGWKCAVERRHSTGQKELRVINSLEPVMSGHRLVVHPDAIRLNPSEPREHELQWQIAAITRERNALKEDGRIDALAGCVKEWMDVLRLNPQKAALTSRQRLIDEALKEHRMLTGQKGREARWFSNARR